MEDNQSTTVKKDMGDDFNEKLSAILTMIDSIKIALAGNPLAITYLTERIHAWYMKLYGKMEHQNLKGDIIKQQKLQEQMFKINPPVTFVRGASLSRESKWEVTNTWMQHRNILEQREQHLNLVMEKLGLTNIKREEKKRLY